MPLGIEQAQAERHRLHRQILELGQRFTLHALLDGFAILVHAVQLRRHLTGQTCVFGQQTFDAQAHVVQAPCCVQARADNEAQIGGGDTRMIALGHFEDRLDPRPGTSSANPLQALMHQNPVVGIQRHHVGHAAKSHQIEQFADIRLRPACVPAQLAQPRTQGHQHIENHPDAGQRLARKLATGLVRIDDGIGQRQLVTGQVVVGDEHLEPGLFRRCHAFDAGDAVVDGDQQMRLTLKRHRDDFRCQAIAVVESVGHQIVDMCRPQQTQTQGAHGARRRAVGIKVADDQNALTLFERSHQQIHRGIDALELLERNQPRQALVQFRLGQHAPSRVQAGQQRRNITEEWQGVGQQARFDAHGVKDASLQYVG
ncbi:hypothetical protein D3C73_498070 [compost metagenome]